MDPGSLFLILAVVILVVLFVSRPFLEKTPSGPAEENLPGEPTGHQVSSLLAERDRVLNSIQELDFDNVLGKIPAGEYETQRSLWLARGAQILQQLDTYQAVPSAQSIEDRIEAVIAARRVIGSQVHAGLAQPAGGSLQNPSLGGDDLEELIASRRQVREEAGGGFCPTCGKPVQKSDRFCPKCGASLG
jgi:hypothetical protein